jgi:hypothetical protein
MACCALAAFILSQIILGIDTLRLRLGLSAPGPEDANPNATWRLGDAPRTALPRRGLRPFALPFTAAAIALGLVIGALWFEGGHVHPQAFSSVEAWCRSTAPFLVADANP